MTSEERLRAAAVTAIMPSRQVFELARACRHGADALVLLQEWVAFTAGGTASEDGPRWEECVLALLRRADGGGDAD